MDVTFDLIKQGIGGLVLENWAMQEAVRKLTPPAPAKETLMPLNPPAPKAKRGRKPASSTPAPPLAGS